MRKIILIIISITSICCKDKTDEKTLTGKEFADVTSVTASGSEENYQFSVTISSPDSGCEKYADWWEVLSTEGNLLYRRVLLHSHVNEQPFTRSGGPIAIGSDDHVWVRAHMNNSGYGGIVMFGSASAGFKEATIPNDFAQGVETMKPLPMGCNF